MAGEYRTESVLAKLPENLANAIRGGLRIALTNQPMTGLIKHPELASDMSMAFEVAGEFKYADGLRSGAMIPITPFEKYWAPGELFFRS